MEGEKVKVEKKKFSLEQLFDNKQFLRVFSVVVAVLLWIVVAMTNKDTVPRTIHNVPVNMDLQSANLQNLQLELVDDVQYYVDVEVNGPRTEVGQLTADSPELATTVKLGQITEKGDQDLPVVSALSDADLAKLSFDIISYSPARIQVTLDRFKTESFEIQPVVKGVSTAPPYIYDRQYVSPNRVAVTGPEAELEKVARAQVTLDLEETLESTKVVSRPVELYDVQGQLINLEDHHLSIDTEEAVLTISVLKETGLPLEVRFLNVPRNFPLAELQECMTMSHDYASIAGPQDVVDSLTEIVLGYIDIKDLRLDEHTFSYSLGLDEISEEIRLLDDIGTVTVDFDDTNWTSAVLNLSGIEVINQPDGYVVQPLNNALYNVEFVGDAETLESLTADDVVIELDLSEREVTPGQQTYPVKICVPGKGLVWAVGDHSVVIQVAEK